MGRLNKPAMLHSAIHQMRQGEKRLFKLEINKLKKGSDYSKVFNYMLSTKTYDEQKLRKYIQKNKIASLHTTIGYLFDKLITFLTIHRSPSMRFPKIRHEIEKIAAESETMYQLGFVRQAHKTRKKAYELALEHEQYDLAAHNFFFLFSTERQHSMLGLSFTELHEKTAETNFRDLVRLWSVKMELYIMAQKAVDFSNNIETTEADWKPIIENPIFGFNLHEFDFVVKVLTLKIKSSYHSWKLEYQKSIHFSNEIIIAYRENQKKFVDFFENFLIANANRCIYLYQLKHSNLEKYALEFGQLADEYMELSVNTPPDKMDNIHIYHTVLNSFIQLSKVSLQESFTNQEVNKWSLTENTVKKPWIAATMSILISAYMYLLLKKYDKFQEYIAMLMNNASSHSFVYTEWELTLLSLIADFEDSTNMYFQSKLKNVIRRSKKSTVPKTVIYMLHLLDKLRKTKSPEKVLKAALPEIMVLEPQRHTILHFSIWVKWRSR